MPMLARGAGLAAFTVLAACSGSEAPRADQPPADAPANPAAAPAANVVTVTARDYAFDAPRQIPAGLTTFRFVGRTNEPHHGILVRLDEGKTFDDFAAALKQPGPPPAWAHLEGGMMIGDPEKGSNVTMTLTPGLHALICFVPSPDGVPHFAKGMVVPIEVTGPAAEAAEPEADIVLRLVDYDFQFSKPLTPGEHVIRVETAPGQPHELVLLRLADGTTAEQAAAWEMEGRKGEQPFRFVGGVAPMDGGRHAYIKANFEPGNYALICFIPDAKDGKPHIAHGMLKEIKVG
ncbi:MAG: hypothetical protein ACREOF_13095 [Gemmatimonadales bacterium]